MTTIHPARAAHGAAEDGRIAVVGLGLRFPGGNDSPEGFERFLREGRSGIGPLPADRWDVAAFAAGPGADGENGQGGQGGPRPGTVRTTAGGFLDRIDEFDAAFFNIPPKQAPFIDPQQRLLLETAWVALEHANIDPSSLRHGNSGVYIGSSPVDFPLALDGLAYEQLDGSLSTGMGAYSLSGRLSYFLGLRGPSLTTDTACASSLTALHLAVGGLRRGECDLALCGGVNALHHPRTFVILSHAQMLAPDGRCKSFDESADGYARAEGCGVLVLKRLRDARRDGDTVLAVVRGTAIGQDGESAGLSAPNGLAQQAVMRAALADAGLEPGDIQYVEAHGTGTPLGDPIEMNSINAVFGAAHSERDPVIVGSLKSNLGHMEPAAGVGGLAKTILQMRAGEFFPHLIDKPSARIPWDSYPIRLAEGGRPWDAPVRRATVNGFGVAGAIGVAVLEQAPSAPAGHRAPRSRDDAESAESAESAAAVAFERDDAARPEPATPAPAHVVTISAKTRAALGAQLDRYRDYVVEHPPLDTDGVRDLCFTRATGRAHLRYRFAVPVRDGRDLEAALARRVEDEDDSRFEVLRKTAFLFTGSGSQYPGMGYAAYRRFPRFRESIDECDRLLSAHLGRSVTDVMFGLAPDAEDVLARTEYTHAALFALEYSLARLWISWGVRPAALLGHSVGEIAAAAVAGLFTLPDAVAFLLARARLIASLPEPGGMAAVAAPVERVRPLLEPWPDLGIGAINAPEQCVVSGGAHSLLAAAEALRAEGMTVTPVPVAAPFHSPLTARLSDGLRAALAGVRFHEPEYPIISNLTGAPAAPGEMADAEYWVRHLNQTVDFAAGVAAVDARGRHAFLEVGPSSVLTSLARRCVAEERHRWIPCLRRSDPTDLPLMQAAADLYAAGVNLDWPRVYEGVPARRVPLPVYAFDRRRYWLPSAGTASAGEGRGGFGLLGRESTGSATAGGAREFTARLSTVAPAYLADHTLRGHAFLPAAAYVEMLLCAADAVFGTTDVVIEDLRMPEALFLGERPTELRTRLFPREDGSYAVDFGSAADGRPMSRVHAHAVLRPPARGGGTPAPSAPSALWIDRSADDDAGTLLGADEVYAAYRRSGLDYGPEFRRALWVRRLAPGTAVGEISATGCSPAEHLPPPLFDAATHTLAALLDDGYDYVATGISRIRVHKKPRAGRLTAVARLTAADERERRRQVAYLLDVTLYEGEWPVLELSGMAFRRLGRQDAGRAPATGTATATGADAREAADAAGATAPAGSMASAASAVSAVSAAPETPAMPAGPGPERVAWLTRLIRERVAELLRIGSLGEVDAHTSFLELGVDSLVALELKTLLERALGASLTSGVVFAHPTPDRLAEHLDAVLAPAPDPAAAVPAGTASA